MFLWLFQTYFWLSRDQHTAICADFVFLWFYFKIPSFCSSTLFIFPYFLTFKPQVTPKPKIIVFWMRSNHMISFWTWPNESDSFIAPSAYEQSPFPSGLNEWLNGSELTCARRLFVNVQTFGRCLTVLFKILLELRRYPDHWIIFMYLETSVLKKLSSPPSISVLQATG